MQTQPREAPAIPQRKPLRLKTIDRTLADEIMRHPGGEKLALCYQCGTCAGGCPVGKATASYSPREIIHKALLGLRDDVLSDEAPWLCASCFTCQERCPQGVEVADLMLAIRNIAVSEGHVPKASVDQGLTLIEHGRLVSVSSIMNRRRAELGLPDIPSVAEPLRKVMEETGFVQLVNRLKEGK